MTRKRKEEPGSRTAAFRNLLKHEDLTTKMVRRRTALAFAGWIAALALAGWLLAISGDRLLKRSPVRPDRTQVERY